ncbi:Hypothetical protein FKW44_001913 [Caligus rogercresseyi]|uniref:Uncharacterized protein n=1 Tax=Caligus rogercresseyi TaxID=217165 RepID=A0A7T8QVX3_CALRO|nr:Hypothetical protein FKW44_001913 [Caligus rogercresseyi]
MPSFYPSSPPPNYYEGVDPPVEAPPAYCSKPPGSKIPPPPPPQSSKTSVSQRHPRPLSPFEAYRYGGIHTHNMGIIIVQRI